MSGVTDADRERAREIILAGDSGPESWVQILAAALAEEREKARAPFLALADRLDLEANEADERSRLYRGLGVHPTADTWAGDAGATGDAAARIRRAAEDDA